MFDYKVKDIFDPGALADNSVDAVYDNYGAKGTADKAMPAMKPGGVFLLLPGGEDGALRARSHCHFRKRVSKYVSDSGIKWTSG